MAPQISWVANIKNPNDQARMTKEIQNTRRDNTPRTGASSYLWTSCLVTTGHPERMEITQPRVARNELPWGEESYALYPERVVSGFFGRQSQNVALPLLI